MEGGGWFDLAQTCLRVGRRVGGGGGGGCVHLVQTVESGWCGCSAAVRDGVPVPAGRGESGGGDYQLRALLCHPQKGRIGYRNRIG